LVTMEFNPGNLPSGHGFWGTAMQFRQERNGLPP
jgi:hypothetical protein